MRKFEREKQLHRSNQLKFSATIVVLMVLLLGAAQLIVSNRLANLGVEIEKENAKTELLTAENRLLEEELRQQESLIAISQKATELGFIEAKSIYYLVPQVPVAMK